LLTDEETAKAWLSKVGNHKKCGKMKITIWTTLSKEVNRIQLTKKRLLNPLEEE
jgi:hypothetical protein